VNTDSASITTTIRLNLDEPGAVQTAVDALASGKVIAFPTDTVYGVGVHAHQPAAVTRLYQVKDRPSHMPIPLLLPDAAAMDDVCSDIPSLAWRLAERFWPGGLSLILTRSSSVPLKVTAGGDTVAVRVPDHSLVWELCGGLGAPLAATSANIHGQPAPSTAAEVMSTLAGRIPLVLDGGPCPGTVASTVLDLTVSPPRILRPGPISEVDLASVVPWELD
jgi:L-threonylcarbamoyladenylate synthase